LLDGAYFSRGDALLYQNFFKTALRFESFQNGMPAVNQLLVQ